jgi:hypothetical protein
VSTPTFQATSADFDTVRFYTELDPYYYTIDNRPLQDLDANTQNLAISSDAARRAVLIEALSASSVFAGLFGAAKSIVGLRASATTATTITLTPGALLVPGAISAGDARQVLRVGASPLPTVLNTPAPVTLGREFTYIVQAKISDFSGSLSYPNYDSGNAYLPSTLQDGYLTASVVVGAEANTGASVAPTVTPGYDALYTVVSVAGAAFPVITLNAASPTRSNAISAEESWVTPTLTNSWVTVASFQTPQYKRVGSRIQIRGSLQSGTAATAAFTLPAGYRPLTGNSFATATGNPVTISATGTVVPTNSAVTHLGLIEFTVD